GARIGCFITKNKELYQTALKFAQTRLRPSLAGQIAAEAAIDTPDRYFEAVSKEYTARRNTLVDGLNKIDGVFCPVPGGAFYVVAKLPIDDADKFCEWISEKFSYNDEAVTMAPAAGFYSSPNVGTDRVRLAYVLKQEDLHSALICLEKALEVYPGRTASL